MAKMYKGVTEAAGDFDLNDLVNTKETLKEPIPIPELKTIEKVKVSLTELAMDWKQLKNGDKVKITLEAEVIQISPKGKPYPTLAVKTKIGVKVFWPDNDPIGLIVTQAVERV